jgi:hypothetical protein
MSDLFDGIGHELKKRGVRVKKVKGWQGRTVGGTFSPRGVLCHHTASDRDSGPAPALGTVTFGRSDLPGPLSNFLLARDGTVYFIAAGRCNHAGLGGPIKGIPLNSGNTFLFGIEAENNGVDEKWPEKQMNAYAILCAVLCEKLNVGASQVLAHKEYTSRKIDPHFDMDIFRKRVRREMK